MGHLLHGTDRQHSNDQMKKKDRLRYGCMEKIMGRKRDDGQARRENQLEHGYREQVTDQERDGSQAKK